MNVKSSILDDEKYIWNFKFILREFMTLKKLTLTKDWFESAWCNGIEVNEVESQVFVKK